ncbi:MAG TPA: glycosyltransferase family 9 protein [Gemmatimonadaceae bacterium]|nr:glycosyltransferase family 9 protein [Gemmatimonadaceae bacterium]
MRLSDVEKAWRRGWMRSIGALSTGERVAEPPAWRERQWSVLYMRTQGIGDVILATGILRAIASAQSTVSLDVLTTATAAPVLEGNPYVRRVHTLQRSAGGVARLTRELRRARYDVVVDGKITRGSSFIRSPALTMASRAPYRIGVGGGNHDLVFNLCVDRFDRRSTHMVDGSATLAMPFGVDVAHADFRPEIFLTASEIEGANRQWCAAGTVEERRGERWLINISAGAALRRWPNERWIELIAHLRRRRPTSAVVVIGNASELASVIEVARASNVVAVRTESLRAALAMVGTSTRVITADTSITHAASAFCVPTLVLIQRGLTQWLPWHTPHVAAYWTGATIESLGVPVACEALDELLVSAD